MPLSVFTVVILGAQIQSCRVRTLNPTHAKDLKPTRAPVILIEVEIEVRKENQYESRNILPGGGFLDIVIPEPSSLGLLGTGLIGLAGLVWTRKGKRPRTEVRLARLPVA